MILTGFPSRFRVPSSFAVRMTPWSLKKNDCCRRRKSSTAARFSKAGTLGPGKSLDKDEEKGLLEKAQILGHSPLEQVAGFDCIAVEDVTVKDGVVIVLEPPPPER